MVQQIIFHGKIVAAKQETIDTIKSNIAVIDELKDNVRVLDTNEALNSVRSSEGSTALQVILDALPSESNADALRFRPFLSGSHNASSFDVLCLHLLRLRLFGAGDKFPLNSI